MRTILVPCDFSKEANIAVEYAVRLSKKMLAKVEVLHVVEQPGVEYFDGMADGLGGNAMENIFTMKLIEKMTQKLAELKEKYKAEDIGTDIKLSNSIYDEIVRKAQNLKADLIVMGSKGASGVEGAIVGSNTEKIVRISPCPVMTVKSLPEKNNVEHMVYASNFENENSEVMRMVKLYQEIFGANLHLVRICTPQNFENTDVIFKNMKDVVEKHDLKNVTLHSYNDFYEEDGIINFTNYHNFDLIAMKTRGRGGMAQFFVGSIAEDVVNQSYKPVLTFNLKAL